MGGIQLSQEQHISLFRYGDEHGEQFKDQSVGDLGDG